MGQQWQHPVCWASPPPWVRQWCQPPTDNTTCRTLQVRNIRLGPSEYSTWSFIIFNMGLCNIQHGPTKYSTWDFQVAMFESQMVVNCTWSCHWWQVRAQLEIVWSRYFDLGSRYFSPNYSPTTVQLPRPHSVLQNSPGQEQMRRRCWSLCFSLNKAQSASERCLQQSTSLRGVLPV